MKLLDFGLAEQRTRPLPPGWADAVTHTTPIGAPGMVLGTLQYLAPEQLEGNEADERTDLFACGAVIYEMLTGRKAFDGNSPAAVIAAILQRDRPSITTVQPSAPPPLEHVVSTCPGGTLIGAFPAATYDHEERQLAPGDTMVLFSDGITEAMNVAGEEFGETRVREVVQGVLAESPERILNAVFEAVHAFARGAAQHDDLTAVVLRITRLSSNEHDGGRSASMC